jgi:hypothetical protein
MGQKKMKVGSNTDSQRDVVMTSLIQEKQSPRESSNAKNTNAALFVNR